MENSDLDKKVKSEFLAKKKKTIYDLILYS